MTIGIAGDHLAHTHALRITCQRRSSRPALEELFLLWLRNSMDVIDQPDGGETRLVGNLSHASDRLVGFDGIFDACQVHGPALRQGHTKLERHTHLFQEYEYKSMNTRRML